MSNYPVPPNIIQAFTDSCKRSDCNVTVERGAGTIMHHSTHYNKKGDMVFDDPNHTKYITKCSICGGVGEVHVSDLKIRDLVITKGRS